MRTKTLPVKLQPRPPQVSITTAEGLADLWWQYHGNDAKGILEGMAQQLKGKKAHAKKYEELNQIIQILQTRSH